MSSPTSADEMEVARRRMRHLAPWRVTPVPAVHVAAKPYPQPPMDAAAKERCKRLALRVLAVQMIEAWRSSEPSPGAG